VTPCLLDRGHFRYGVFYFLKGARKIKHSTDTLWTAITLAYRLGGFDNLVVAFAIFMACDYITGIMEGGKNGKISSYRAFRGVGKSLHDYLCYCSESVRHHCRK
jgi:hypothetical protein